MFVSCVCCLGSDLCDKLITRSEESCRMRVSFVWSGNLNIESTKARDGLLHKMGEGVGILTLIQFHPFKKIVTFPKTNAN